MKICKYSNSKKGQMIVLFALLLPILLGFTGLAIDLGNLYYQKSHLQNMVDAGALAGANKIVSATNHIAANAEAQKYVDLNTNTGEEITVDFPDTFTSSKLTYDPNTMLVVKASKEVKTYFMGILSNALKTYTISAIGVAQVENVVTGAFSYSIFSGATDKPLSISSGVVINGNAHTNQNLDLSGGPSIFGRAEALENIYLSNNSTISYALAHGQIIGSSPTTTSVKSNVSSITELPMPDIANTIKLDAQATGQVYTSDPKFKNMTFTGSTYVDSSVTISGSNIIDATGQLLATDNIKISGNITAVGSPSQQQLLIYTTASGNAVTISGTTIIDGVIYAPNGDVKISGNVIINGSIVAKSITITGNLTLNGEKPISVPSESTGQTKTLLVQ